MTQWCHTLITINAVFAAVSVLQPGSSRPMGCGSSSAAPKLEASQGPADGVGTAEVAAPAKPSGVGKPKDETTKKERKKPQAASQDWEGQAIAAGDRQRAAEPDRRAEERGMSKKDDRIAEAAAVRQVMQIESDEVAARRLRREMEEEEAAKLAEQERLARKLLEEERAAMADIRAAQEESVQRRQGSGPYAQSLVLQVSLASSARLHLFIFLPHACADLVAGLWRSCRRWASDKTSKSSILSWFRTRWTCRPQLNVSSGRPQRTVPAREPLGQQARQACRRTRWRAPSEEQGHTPPATAPPTATGDLTPPRNDMGAFHLDAPRPRTGARQWLRLRMFSRAPWLKMVCFWK